MSDAVSWAAGEGPSAARSYRWRSKGSRLGIARVSGDVQGGHGDGGEQRRHPVQQGFDRTQGWQMQENPVLVLFDLCSHVEEGQDHGAGLGRSEGRVGEGLRAQGLVEDRCGAGEQEARGVGHERRV